ncbi:BTAD domain-containing putative transcriptional regulator [Nonomuraea sp. NPDC050556]|uniref:AfsR/SARP family transcriptional regulator n=1 Tax=Nonomuraea sp. NPDC050556 TaxID=3364369 RepID=UPI0037A90271
MGDLTFSLLGPVRAWRGEAEVELGSPQQRLVLAALVLAEGRTIGHDQLIDMVWGEAQPRSALSTLRTYVSRLRAVLGGEVIASVGDGYAIRVGECDLAVMERLYAEERYAEAAALWQGEPLGGLDGLYVEAQRARLAERRLAVLERRLALDVEQGRHAEVVSELNALSAEHPTRERLRGLLMLALYRSGRQAEAIGVFTDTRELLAEELGIDPSAELAQLYQQIISADPSLTSKQQHTLVNRVPRQLPADAADFTGRESELADMVGALRSGDASALVISAVAGAGGVGKTTLAVHVAHQLVDDYPDGQLFVDLRGSSPHPAEPGAVLASFLRAFGVEDPPEELAERAALYRSMLADLRVLVLLDNAEGIGQVRPLLPGAAGCAVLATSRARLIGLTGARQVDLEVLGPVDALELFTRIVGDARARAERGAAMDLVAACGFLPLAIRIAAARLAARPNWSVARMRDRLADERRRLAELRTGDLAVEATFSLGYDQLDAAHQRAFRLLSVPDAPVVSLSAAAALLDLDVDEAEDVCEALVDVSMLESPSPAHYRFHDLLRIYARSKVEEEVREAALSRLLEFLLATMSAAFRFAYPGDRRPEEVSTSRPGLAFADEEAAVDWADEEEATIMSCVEQAAHAHGTSLTQVIQLLDMASDALGFESDPAGYERLTDLLVAAAVERGDLVAQSRALCLRGTTRMNRRLIDGAEDDGRTARELSLRAGDDDTYADSLNLLALAAMARRDNEDALDLYGQAVEVWRERGDLADLSLGLSNLARALAEAGRFAEAVEAAEEANRIVVALGEGRPDPNADYQLAIVLRSAGRPEQALDRLDQALTEFRRFKQRTWEGAVLFRMAETYLAIGLPSRAVDCAEDALAVVTEAGDDWGQGMTLTVLGRALGELGQPARSRACLAEALEIFERLSLPEASDVRDLLAAASV